MNITRDGLVDDGFDEPLPSGASIIRYGLLYKGKLLGYYMVSNRDGDFCVDDQHILDEHSADKLCLVEEKNDAERAIVNDVQWYNAGHRTPSNPYVGKELKVVKVEISYNLSITEI